MSARVWCQGDAVVDLLPEANGRLMQCPGGADTAEKQVILPATLRLRSA